MGQTKATDARRNGRFNRELSAYSAAANAALSVEKERERAPDSRLAIYSGVAGAALVGAFTADAAIHHTANAITMSAGNTRSTFTIVDPDGTNGVFQLQFNNAGTGSTGKIDPLGANASVVTTETMNELVNYATNETIKGTGTIHGNTVKWGKDDEFLFFDKSVSTGEPPDGQGHFWDTATGYVGIRFNDGATTQYGWIHINSVSNGLEQYSISGYAYDDTGGSIQAGAGEPAPGVPEPSTIALALLAAGAAGVMRSRRKKLMKEKGEG